MKRINIVIILLVFVQAIAMARPLRIYGYVVDTDNRGIEFVGVYTLQVPTIGATTNRNGYYELILDDIQDSATIVYQMMGYHTRHVIIPITQSVVNINVELEADATELDAVEVRGIRRQTYTMEQIDVATTRVIPDATGGGIESLLITFAGVNQNNELSSQYNVRGGSFDENEVYVNGIEVHRPLLIRSGQQEGLSFVNPEMVDNAEFSAGGFGARYGDKMSSVLDITYKRPTIFSANLQASLLGASAYIGHGDSTFSQMHGIRYKTSSYMLGALSTAGNYKPNYFDYQTYMNWRIGDKRSGKKNWSISLLANYSQNSYQFVPDSLSESFGGMEGKNLRIWYDGQEKDMFRTGFAALSTKGKVSKEVEIGFDLSGFITKEQENFDITGEYILSNQPPDGEGGGIARPGSMTESDDKQTAEVLGSGTYHVHARNQLTAGVITLAHHGSWKHNNNQLDWGISGQAELLSDRINEWEHRDSAHYSLPYTPEGLELYYAMRGESKMRSGRLQAYIENTHRWYTDGGQWTLSVGGRLNWWSYTNEVLPSPRASISYQPEWKHDFCFRLATGLYYQAPFYKELRDTITDAAGVTRIQLNEQLRAQRSVHVILGGDYYFRAWGRPFKLTAEAYYKYMDRLVSYTVDNVRVRYSGKNDAEGYALGLDLKLYGELVPGADSWISFSTMRSRQKLIDHPEIGWMPSPQEQRYSFSMLFQDYFPQFPALRFHLKFIYSDGMPFSAPRNIASQATFRTPAYRRADIGATYQFDRKTAKFMRSEKAKHIDKWSIQFEVFNLIGWRNVSSYFWVSDAYGQQWASPNYLTGRRYNLKLSIDLK